jgi:hypothetical protein
MITKNTLTGARKMMNMQKLGIVVQSKFGQAKGANPRKQRAGGLMRYTLCEYQGKAKRNSSRHSFAFDIPLIRGRTLGLPPPSREAGKVCFLPASNTSPFSPDSGLLTQLVSRRYPAPFLTFYPKNNCSTLPNPFQWVCGAFFCPVGRLS